MSFSTHPDSSASPLKLPSTGKQPVLCEVCRVILHDPTIEDSIQLNRTTPDGGAIPWTFEDLQASAKHGCEFCLLQLRDMSEADYEILKGCANISVSYMGDIVFLLYRSSEDTSISRSIRYFRTEVGIWFIFCLARQRLAPSSCSRSRTGAFELELTHDI